MTRRRTPADRASSHQRASSNGRASSDRFGTIRCAIYTRKSTEEGLEQAFNSLHAQREACEAYVLSQRHEGWSAIATAYDDGGFSGGTMERPALQTLLADIRAGQIDVVVVYKVDRLTRSLSDFAKIVEIFDAHDVSFVSVTQAFNTTTSMGRLTLNVLLSFAQFEREVTAERIRDKMAASKRKGMWMGGFVPLGYDAIDKKLVINGEEAEAVRTIFNLYLALGTVRQVKAEVDRLGILTKRRTVRDQRVRGGRPLSRGYVYAMLTNPLYRGKIRYRGEIHEGEHEAIIDEETWDRVQATLIDNARKARGRKAAASPSLLAGRLYTEDGIPFTPSHAVKDGKRYRYYIERPLIDGNDQFSHEAEQATGSASSDRMPSSRRRGWRIPAHDIEEAVLRGLAGHLCSHETTRSLLDNDHDAVMMLPELLDRAAALAAVLESGSPQDRLELVQTMVEKVTIRDAALVVAVQPNGLRERLGIHATPSDRDDAPEIVLPVAIRRRGVEMTLVLEDQSLTRSQPKVDAGLVRAIAQAQAWFDRIAIGEATGPGAIAEQDGLARTDVSRALSLAFLAPDIVQAILDGRQPPGLTTTSLLRLAARLPADWHSQRLTLGFTAA